MGVSNINSQNSIAQLALKQQAAKTASAQKPAYMQMTGSIFNAPGVKNQTSASTLSDLNTTRSLNDLNNKTSAAPQTKKSTTPSTPDDIANIDNAADGQAAANSASAQGDNVERQTAETEANTRQVQGFDRNAQNLSKSIAKDDKKFAKQMEKQQAEFKKDTKELEKLTKETEEIQTEIEDAQKELDTLLGSASFSINKNSTGGTAANPNQERINELSNIIGSKITLVQSNGQQIHTLQRSSQRTIKQMNKTNVNYVKTQQVNQKNLEENQSTTQKVINVATKIEQVAQLVTQVGTAVNTAGKVLVALGSSTSWLAGAGSALIAVGQVMQKVGTVVEMVGNYGQTAANITKTAAYAADGNLAGALTSAASAIQTGSAAVKTTKGLDKSFKQINQQAEQATQKLASNAAARDAVKGMTDEQLGGMSKKEMRKSISGQLQSQMAEGNLDANSVLSDLKNGQLSEGNFNAVNNAANQASTSFASAVEGAGGTIKDGAVSGLSRKARKDAGKKAVSKFTNTATDTVKSSQKFDWSKLSNGLMATAAKLNSMNSANQTAAPQTTETYVPQWDLSQDARFQSIKNARLRRTGAMA